ncbi:substrate-binding domain-containing protein [Streptomyces calidiresistens]|uniref:ABC transporter substrate-binding protein n=1 Tax=Streptomyces calidiresistens TaxID=1485586 RepID=A0A7W3T4F6_9ACTN|nr:substrate-binding domain-containing protein [Streptomyces calidiresistens]MBB0230732.1 ABC transporter substrate-binding protein [Streptomyces calidiresistens]
MVTPARYPGRRLAAGPPPPLAETLDIALVVPARGPAGLLGPACELCAVLAAQEVNAAGGVLGREVRLIPVDGGAPPSRVADEVEAMVVAGTVRGVTGWHISSVRRALAPRLAGRVPYVYTALYEGGENTEGVYLVGETPDGQLAPAMRWLAGERRVRRWHVVGNDYVWPRRTARAARLYARATGGVVRGESYLPLGAAHGSPEMERALDDIERGDADAVLMLLVGSDAVCFNRAFAARGLDAGALRLSTLMDENMLVAGGADASRGLYSTAGFFGTLATADTLDFHARYAARHGPTAPVPGSPGQSCYEGVLLLAELIARAGSPEVPAIEGVTAAGGVRWEGARGVLGLTGRHVRQRIYLSEADGLDFSVLVELDRTPRHHR